MEFHILVVSSPAGCCGFSRCEFTLKPIGFTHMVLHVASHTGCACVLQPEQVESFCMVLSVGAVKAEENVWSVVVTEICYWDSRGCSWMIFCKKMKQNLGHNSQYLSQMQLRGCLMWYSIVQRRLHLKKPAAASTLKACLIQREADQSSGAYFFNIFLLH